jgi:uncharacterized membrane protein
MLTATAARLTRVLHQLFEASLFIKGLLAAAEALAGLGLMWTSNAVLQSYVDWLTRHEIAQDPHDGMAVWAQTSAQALSIETQHFYALYLLAHGGLKLAMVLGLARRVVWAYPAAMVLLAGFVAYQLEHWTVTHAPVLLLLSAFDAMMIALIWREYRAMRAVPLST